MVSKIISFINKTVGSLHEAALLLALSSFGSQILALIRDRYFAHVFGASRELDIYYSAFRIPDLLYATIGSVVSVTILLPLVVSRLRDGSVSAEAKRFVNSVATIFCLVIGVMAIGLFFLIPKLSMFVVPGFSEPEREIFISISRILLLSPIFLGISNLLGTITQTFHKFYIYALSPILYNLGIILGIALLYPIFGLRGLVAGVILGAFMHALIQLPTVIKSGFNIRPTFSIEWRGVGELLKISFPRTIALSASAVVMLVLTLFATKLGDGAVSVFTFAFNLQSVPLAIIGMSYSVAAFPLLSRLYVNGSRDEFISHIEVAARHIIFWSMPVISLFIVLRAHIVRVVLGTGQFDWSSTRLVAAALALFTISLFAQSLVLLFVRAFYAAGRTKIPLYINLFSSVATIIFAWIFISKFPLYQLPFGLFNDALRTSGVGGSGILLLPLSYSIGMFINILLLWLFFRLNFGKLPSKYLSTIWQSLCSAIIIGVVAKFTLELTDQFLPLQTFWGILTHGFISAVSGILVGGMFLIFARNSELEDFISTLRRRFWKSKPVSSGLGDVSALH